MSAFQPSQGSNDSNFQCIDLNIEHCHGLCGAAIRASKLERSKYLGPAMLKCDSQRRSRAGHTTRISISMEAGLSHRMKGSLRKPQPSSAASLPSQQDPESVAIDLSNAENEVLRSELLEFFKTTVEDKLTEKVCSQTKCRICTNKYSRLLGFQTPMAVTEHFEQLLRPSSTPISNHIIRSRLNTLFSLRARRTRLRASYTPCVTTVTA